MGYNVTKFGGLKVFEFQRDRLRGGVFHLHAHREDAIIVCTVVPNEGLDWGNATVFEIPDDGVLGVPVQAELALMDDGFEATWSWQMCREETTNQCFVGQFAREGSLKAVRDSRAQGFDR